MLRADCVSVTIGRKPIVQPISFDAQCGECWMLLGPNGAGKITLLHALAGTQPC